jgi:hypothetical protein
MADSNVTVKKNTESYIPEIAKTLAAQKQVKTRVPLPLGADPAKVRELPVGINGHWYHIKYGQATTVPDEVYRILVRGGHVVPTEEEYESEMPTADPMTSSRLADRVKELQ